MAALTVIYLILKMAALAVIYLILDMAALPDIYLTLDMAAMADGRIAAAAAAALVFSLANIKRILSDSCFAIMLICQLISH